MNNTEKNEILVAIAKLGIKIDSIQEQVTDLKEQTTGLQEQVTDLKEQTTGLQEQVTEIKEDTRNISRSVAVIEQEYGDKLKALFDAFTINTEKIETQKERIHFCEKKLENHNTEIDYLITKVQGL